MLNAPRFRAWHTELKKMFYVISMEWYADTFDVCAVDITNTTYERMEQVDAELVELMRYSGFQDLNIDNPRDIYEGDILELNEGAIATIKFVICKNVSGLQITPMQRFNLQSCFDQDFYTTVKVIGNIYENPELLNV